MRTLIDGVMASSAGPWVTAACVAGLAIWLVFILAGSKGADE